MVAVIEKNGKAEALAFDSVEAFILFARRRWETQDRSINSIDDAVAGASADNTTFTIYSNEEARDMIDDVRVDILKRNALKLEIGEDD